MNYKTLIILIIIILAAANVYQYRNPQVVEVPGEQTAIDSTAWVQRAAYAARGVLLDSLEEKNEKLAERIRKTRDEIANVTDINGRLNLQVDSLETVSRLPLLLENLPESELTWQSSDSIATELWQESEKPGYSARSLADTSYNFIGIFGNGLFRVDSEVRFVRRALPESERPWQSSGERLLQDPHKFVGDSARSFYIENELDLTQLRDIEITVVNTMNKDRSRMLTYVTSKDFEKLEYQTYTELKRRKRWPWFLVGVGVGVVGIELIQ